MLQFIKVQMVCCALEGQYAWLLSALEGRTRILPYDHGSALSSAVPAMMGPWLKSDYCAGFSGEGSEAGGGGVAAGDSWRAGDGRAAAGGAI
jgi:hypothetical protein